MQYLGELYETVSRKSEALKDAIISAPEGEVLVRQATNDEKWGPSGSLMLQIADMTNSFQHLPYISKALWERISERADGRNWRTVYKGLLLLDYILKNGSEQFVNDARQHSRYVNDLSRFDYIDTEGVDRGISVRERAKLIYELIHDTKSLREERKKAKTNRGKFTTSISSNGGGFGSDSFSSGSRYGGFGSDSSNSHRHHHHKQRRPAGEFGDDSDDELDAGTRNKRVEPKHKAPESGAEWEPFPGAPASSASNDDDWADFTGSRNATAAATSFPAAAAPAPAQPKTIDLLAGLNLGGPTPAPVPAASTFSPFATPVAAPAPAPAPLTFSSAPAQPAPQVISLIDSPAKSNVSFGVAPAANSTLPPLGGSSSNKDLFDFGSLGNKSSASKPLSATLSTTAQPAPLAAQPAFGAFAAPQPQPVAYGAPAYGYPVAYPPQPAGYPVGYAPQGYAQPPPSAY